MLWLSLLIAFVQMQGWLILFLLFYGAFAALAEG
jgi:hypothetical protein